MRDLKKNWSHYFRGLEYREPTKEAANIYCQSFVIILFIAKVNPYNPPLKGKKRNHPDCIFNHLCWLHAISFPCHHFWHELL